MFFSKRVYALCAWRMSFSTDVDQLVLVKRDNLVCRTSVDAAYFFRLGDIIIMFSACILWVYKKRA